MATKPRTVQTPGAPTTVDKAEDALEAILGTPDASEKALTPDVATSDTGTASELVANQVSDEVLDQILQKQKSIENKLDQLLAAGGIKPVAKKRWVQGQKGLEYKEV